MRKAASRPTRRFLGLNAELRCTEFSSLLKIEDVAERLRLSVPAVRGLIFRRALPHLKIGRNIRFRECDLVAWLDERIRGAR